MEAESVKEEERKEAKRERVFVGGVGESVTSDDLRKILTSFSDDVEAVEIIRTKGRSFAYVDFLPSSPHSLSKLFSIYNGCAWKGGKLRLERAKEHYLAQLTREWAEDAKLADSASIKDVDVGSDGSVDADEKEKFSKKSKKDCNSDDDKLRIFFPRLRKVKAIPFSGTGKHKYSFRRVEVPSLPKYFCDCEEHSVPPQSAEWKLVSFMEEHGGGVDAEELDMMNSVMKKIFEKDSNSASCGVIELSGEPDNYSKETAGPRLGEKGDSSSDHDDLITNAVAQEQDMLPTLEALKLNKRKGVEGRPIQNVLKKQKKNAASRNMNTKLVFTKQNNQVMLSEAQLNESVSNEDDFERERNHSIKMTEDMQLDKSDGDSTVDDDGLIINVVSHDKGTINQKQESMFNKRQDATARNTRENVLEKQKRSTASLDKNSKLDRYVEDDTVSAVHEGTENAQAGSSDPGRILESQYTKSEQDVKHSSLSVPKSRSPWKDLAANKGSNLFTLSDILPRVSSKSEEQSRSECQPEVNVYGNQKSLAQENQEDQPCVANLAEELAEAQHTKPDSSLALVGRGSAWLQKSSWTQLVSGNNSSAFSISQIIPGLSYEKQEQAKLELERVARPPEEKVKEGKKEPSREGITSSDFRTESSVQGAIQMGHVSMDKVSVPIVEKTQHSATRQTCNRVVTIGDGETCTFMRSAASLKEWAKTKAALSGSLKKSKKRDEKTT